jgi:SAM-dependent methyltransferase
MQYNGINEGTAMMVNNIDEQDFFLKHLRPDMEVLEYGCGESTLTIAPLVHHLTCIEHKAEWVKEIQMRLAEKGIINVSIIVAPPNHEPSADYDDGTYQDFKDYVDVIGETKDANGNSPNSFDIVFIDGRARVECARKCIPYLKPGGLIFIHDYRHPTEIYRRREYEVVEEFLNHDGQVFAIAKFTPKTKEQLAMVINEHVCWYKDEVVEEMNHFYDIHLKNHDLTKHFKAFTDLLFHEKLQAVMQVEGYMELLDLGCGSGILSEFIGEYNYFGADLPHVVAGCAMRNYPQYFYRGCDIYKDDLDWIYHYDVVVINGVLDVMQHPIAVLEKLLEAMCIGGFLIIHRQEIAKDGETRTQINGSYGSVTYHSVINRKEFEDILEKYWCNIVHETTCGFTNLGRWWKILFDTSYQLS